MIIFNAAMSGCMSGGAARSASAPYQAVVCPTGERRDVKNFLEQVSDGGWVIA